MRTTVGGRSGGRQDAAGWCRVMLAGVGIGVVMLIGRAAWAQAACQECDQCMTDCVCHADGTCAGVPKQNGSSCDTGNPCSENDTCQGGTCTIGALKPDDTPCTFPFSGLCAKNLVCHSVSVPGYPAFASCGPNPDDPNSGIVDCPDSGDKCHPNVCDPNTGQCHAFTIPCDLVPCSNGQCDPATGECMPGNEGASCDDSNECTSDDRCHAGACRGSAGAITPQPTTPESTDTPSIPTPTPPASSACLGDCDENGRVTVDEILIMVNLALTNGDVSSCSAADANGDDAVTVDEILTAVNYALTECPAVAPTATAQPTDTSAPSPTATPPAPTGTPTVTEPVETPTATPPEPTATPVIGTATATTIEPTATATPAAPTHTPTPPTATPAATATGNGTALAARAAGTIESTTAAFLVIPDLLSGLLGHLSDIGLAAGGIGIGPFSFTCDSGGGALSCDQSLSGFSFGPPVYTIALNNCQVSGPTGTLTINGTLTATGQEGDFCGTLPNSITLATQNLTVQTAISSASFDFTAAADLSCSTGSCACVYDTISLQTSGTITVAGNGTITQLVFGYGSSIAISVGTYNTECVPTVYAVEVNGSISLTAGNNPAFVATYDGYTLHDDTTSGQDVVEVSGGIINSCFGDIAIDFSTATALVLGSGPCPTAGAVEVTANGNTDLITYSAGGVQIDAGEDGSVDQSFDNCVDPSLFACPSS